MEFQKKYWITFKALLLSHITIIGWLLVCKNLTEPYSYSEMDIISKPG